MSIEISRGRFPWHEPATTDLESGFGFYSRFPGWAKPYGTDIGPAVTCQIFGRTNDRSVGDVFRKALQKPDLSAWLQNLSVGNLAARAKIVTRMSDRAFSGPMNPLGDDRVAQCMDLQGTQFTIYSTAKTSG